jgi:hypothetical protein
MVMEGLEVEGFEVIACISQIEARFTRAGKVEESDIADWRLPEGPGPVTALCRNTTGGRQASHDEIGNGGNEKRNIPQQKMG